MAKLLRIFLSSPGDVAEERALAERVFRRLGNECADAVRLELILWEHEPLFAHAGFQQQIPRPSQCDLVVTILWARLGTRLPADFSARPGEPAPTGTEFEVQDALEAYRRLGRPNLLIYRKTARPHVDLTSADAEERLLQYRRLQEFCQRAFYDSDGSAVVATHSFAEAYSFERKLYEHARRWLDRQLGMDLAARPRWTSGSPFRGLQTFESEHRDIFFGRSQAVSEVLARLREVEAQARDGAAVKRFLLVQGMSGNGKSSLIRAGVLPLLENRPVEGIGLWLGVTLKPSERVEGLEDYGIFGVFAQRFVAALPAADRAPGLGADLAARIRSSPDLAAARLDGYLARAAAAAGLKSSQIRLLLFIDQLEELFAGSHAPEAIRDVARFVAALAASDQAWVLATVRSDLSYRVETLPELAMMSQGAGSYTLAAPRPSELADMVREPMIAAGLEWDSRDGVRLDQVLLREAEASPESLPLMEFALEQLYERRDGRQLTFAAFAAVGGLRGALTAAAEEVVAQSGPNGTTAFPVVMRMLVTVNERGLATRRYASRRELDEHPQARALFEALIARRLCVTDMRGGEAVVLLAHEALINGWSRASQWLLHEGRLLAIRDAVEHDATIWESHARADDWLSATAAKLEDIRELEVAGLGLSPAGRAFAARSRQRARRNAWVFRIAVGLIAALAAGASVFAYVAREQSSAAAKARTHAEREARVADETTDFLVGLFHLADPSGGRGNSVPAREILDRAATRIHTELASQPIVQARLLRSMGGAYHGLGLYGKAKEVLQDALRIAKSLPQAQRDDSEIARIEATLGTTLVAQEDFAAAEPVLTDAIRYLDSQPGLAGDSARARGTLAWLYWSRNDFNAARRTGEEALRRTTAVFGRRSEDVASVLATLGITVRDLGDPAGALPLLEESAATRKALFGEQYPGYAMDLESIGLTLADMQRFQEAEISYKQAVQIEEHVLGPDHPDLAEALQGLGNAQGQVGELSSAETNLARALQIERDSVGPNSIEVARTLMYLARAYEQGGEFAKAEPLRRQAVDIQRSHLPDSLVDYIIALQDLGFGQRYQGRLDEARATLQLALDSVNDPRVPQGLTLGLLTALADVACYRGPNAEGYAYGQRALALLTDTGSGAIASPRLEVYRSEAAECDAEPSRYQQNRQMLEAALAAVQKVFGPTARQTRESERRLATFTHQHAVSARAPGARPTAQ